MHCLAEENVAGKGFTLIPIFRVGSGQEPSNAMLNVVSMFDHGRHRFDALALTDGSIQGKYAYKNLDQTFSLKSGFQIVPQNEGANIEMQYKGKEYVIGGSCANCKIYNKRIVIN